jgi:hypothetical protein
MLASSTNPRLLVAVASLSLFSACGGEEGMCDSIEPNAEFGSLQQAISGYGLDGSDPNRCVDSNTVIMATKELWVPTQTWDDYPSETMFGKVSLKHSPTCKTFWAKIELEAPRAPSERGSERGGAKWAKWLGPRAVAFRHDRLGVCQVSQAREHGQPASSRDMRPKRALPRSSAAVRSGHVEHAHPNRSEPGGARGTREAGSVLDGAAPGCCASAASSRAQDCAQVGTMPSSSVVRSHGGPFRPNRIRA